MKLIEGIKLKGMCVKIPDCSRDELPEFFKQMGYTVGAEIGVYKGEFTEKFCKVGLKIYGVDPWHSYAETSRAVKSQERQEFLYHHTQRVLAPYNDCTIIRKTSMDAVHQFKDRSLDFVYIDGDHNFKNVAEDIYDWSWKVRKGGIVAGHDYCANIGGIEQNINQVRPAIEAYMKALKIKKWYVIGDKDHASSWMFIR